jgi:two-component system sensor histidine kinase UhpB
VARILIVEDRADNRDFLATLLRLFGHHVTEAGSATAALFKLRTESPDLIIADILMQDIDGYEFARRLRMDSKMSAIPIVFWTAAYSRESARTLAEYCGVDCILPKPSEPGVILEVVNDVLSRPLRANPVPPAREFEREHAAVLNRKLFEQVRELEATAGRLRESERQYRALFEGNPLSAWVVDELTARFLKVNEAAVRHYGYSREEFSGLSTKDVIVDDGTASPATFSVGGEAGSATRAAQFHRVKSGAVIEVISVTQRIDFEGRGAQLHLVDDVTERKAAEGAIRQSSEQLRILADRLRSVQEEERTRISRELHDELGQRLTALRMTCEWILRKMPAMLPAETDSDIWRTLNSSIVTIDEMILFVQKTAADLRPGILDFGIGAAIEWSVREFQTLNDISCSLEIPEDELPLDPQRATEVYRIFQEALTNIARHSGASSLRVKLKRERSRLVLSVRDNGRGITPEQADGGKAIGILGMRERAALIGGVVSVSGSPDAGTLVRLEVPLASHATA